MLRSSGGIVIDQPGRVAVILKAGAPTCFRLVGIHREGLVVASAGMRHVIDAAAERAPAPGIEDVEGQRRMHVDGRVQGGRQLPGLEAHAGDELARPAGGGQRHAPSIAGHDMPCRVQSFDLHLQPFDRRIDESHRTTDGTLLAEHIPGLERVPKLEPHAAVIDRPIGRKAEFALGRKPERIEADNPRGRDRPEPRGSPATRNAPA